MICPKCGCDLGSSGHGHQYPPTTPPMLGDSPIEPRLHDLMNAVAKGLDLVFNGTMPNGERSVGFILLTFPFGNKEGRCNYISNGADRHDVVVMLKEQIARFEGQPEMRGTA